MSETTGLKHNRQFDKKLKVAVGRAKVSFKRGNEDERNTRKGKNNNSKYEGGDGDFKLNRRENNGEKRGSRLDSEDRRPRFSKERFGEEGNQEKRFRTENSGFQRKRVYGDRGTGEGGKFSNAGFNRKFSREGGGYSKDNSFRERKSEGGGYTRDDSFRERRKEGGGGGYTKDGSFGERKREGGYYRDDPFRERKREGGYGRDDSFRERKLEGGYGRDDSFREKKREGGYGRDDSFRERKREGGYGRDDSFRERKREGGYGRDGSFRERTNGKGKSDGNELYDPKKFFAGRGRSNDRDGYEMGRNRKSMGNEESSFGAKRSSTRSEGNLRTEKVFSDDKLRSKEKVAFKRVSDKRGGGEDGLLQRKPSKTKPESTTKQVEEKDNKDGDQVGSLERAAKKLLRFKKDRDERSEAKIGVRKKKKRVIRIDPNDISNKRIDDSISVDGDIAEKKVDEEKEIEISKNAQFRAIQPSPTILSFVEDNLLGRRRLIEFRRSGYNIDFPVPLDNVPFSTNTERERVEDPVFRNKLTFFAAAKVSSSFPEPELPEIAFAGRSNVGKSSLLNALTRQWGVVRTSDKPGLTQTINFFTLGPKLSLVDLPGYGFAYAKEEVKDAWEELVKEYVSTRVSLKRVCLLIDTKWGMKPRDHELIHLMERSQTNYQIVLTKTDAVFPIDVARRAVQIEETLKANKSLVEPVMMVSSKTGAGIRCMRTVLSKISRFAKI